MTAVRGAVGDNGENQRLIRTVPRRGFRFVGPVLEEPEPDTAIGAEEWGPRPNEVGLRPARVRSRPAKVRCGSAKSI